jgi:hypothetical protein
LFSSRTLIFCRFLSSFCFTGALPAWRRVPADLSADIRMAEGWKINIKFTTGGDSTGALLLPKCGATTIAELREAITAQCSKVPKRIIVMGRLLTQDTQTLEQAKVQDGQTIHVQPDAAAAAVPPPPPSAAAAAAPSPPAAAAAAAPRPVAPAAAAAARSPIDQAIALVMAQPPATAQALLSTLGKVSQSAIAPGLRLNGAKCAVYMAWQWQ